MPSRFLQNVDRPADVNAGLVGVAHVSRQSIVVACDADFATLVGKDAMEICGQHLGSIHSELLAAPSGQCSINGRELQFKWLHGDLEGAPDTLTIRAATQPNDANERRSQFLETFEELIEVTPVGIVVLDKQKTVVVWNKAAEDIFGYTREEILGQQYPLVPPAQWPQFCELFDRVMDGNGFRGIESDRRRKDGSIVELSMSTTPIRDSEGHVVAALALLNDMSQKKLFEKKLAERARLEAVGQLASGVAHDFNNMLTVVNAHCSFIMRRARLTEPDRESLVVIERCVQQAAELTSQLLTFGRRQIVRPTKVDLNGVIRETVGMLTKVLGPRVDLVMDLMPGLPSCWIDSTQFSQLVVNLVTNARDAMPEGGRVTITTRLEKRAGENTVVLAISDSGTGIPADQLSRVFEPFFTTKKAGEGTGLGLSTAFGIAEQAGGSLEVTSQVGHGSTFKLSLPIARADGAAPRERPQTAQFDQPLHILLVDDDALVRDSLAELMRLEGHDVVPVGTGEQALAELKTSEFDVLVTDVFMPGMSGAELVEQVAQLHPGLPVLFMSGNLAAPGLREKIESGLASVISKPIHPEELERALVDVCSGRIYQWPP